MDSVLIVDDSPTFRLMLRLAIERDPDLQVAGEARNGEEAVLLSGKLHPNIITMDINMPGMGGYEAITRIMEKNPCPIIVLTGVESQELLSASFKALSLGAMTVLPKPVGMSLRNVDMVNIIYQIKTLSSVKVVRRSPRFSTPIEGEGGLGPPLLSHHHETSVVRNLDYKLVAVGISTGGPPALQTLLRSLPVPFPLPIVIVQHISAGFVEGLAKWLTETTGYPCKVAEQDEEIQPGKAYIAPDQSHMEILANGRVNLSDEKPFGALRPAAEVLFISLANNFGPKAIGVIMTGMGHDGANGLFRMHEAGAFTIAQDEKSSIIFGMPKEAIKLGAVSEVLSLDMIGPRLLLLVRKNEK